ncbi:MAG TPA: PEGA domain-containing protein [Polyangia bacterium]|jgi:hypothetical protein|nr:PEGA domain-containing protein [Polyangia bacterium]
MSPFPSFRAALLLVGVLAARTAGAAEDPEVLIKQGVALRKAGEDSKAQGYFQRAYDIAKTPRSAAQLGLVEFALHRWAPAEAHLAEALRAVDDSWIASNQSTLQESLNSVRTHLGRLRVEGTPLGAHVRVGGDDRGELPLTAPLYVPPGLVTVDVVAEGHESVHRAVNVDADAEQRLEIHLTPLNLVTDPQQQANAAERAAAGSGNAGWRGVALGAGIGAAVLLAGGAVALLASNGQYDSFNRQVVPGTNNPRCSRSISDHGGADCGDYLSAGDRDRVLAIVGLAGGGALAVTSAILFIASRNANAKKGGNAVACAPTFPQSMGATCAVRF